MAKEIIPSGGINPPAISDYLPEAIQKAVIDAGIKHPATVYPVAVGAGTGFVGWLFGFPILYAVALAGFLFGSGWAIFQIFFSYEKIGNRYIRELNLRQKEYEFYLRGMLEKELQESYQIKGLEEYAKQGIRQFGIIQENLASIQELLGLKLNQKELTFGRFLGSAEQVSLSVLDNLKDIVSLLKSAAAIKPDYIQDRLNALSKRNPRTEEDIKQQEALKERLQLRESQLQKINTLLTQNEEAMTEMGKISAAVAEWQTDRDFADIDFESAITRLHDLAKLAHEYNQ